MSTTSAEIQGASLRGSHPEIAASGGRPRRFHPLALALCRTHLKQSGASCVGGLLACHSHSAQESKSGGARDWGGCYDWNHCFFHFELGLVEFRVLGLGGGYTDTVLIYSFQTHRSIPGTWRLWRRGLLPQLQATNEVPHPRLRNTARHCNQGQARPQNGPHTLSEKAALPHEALESVLPGSTSWLFRRSPKLPSKGSRSPSKPSPSCASEALHNSPHVRVRTFLKLLESNLPDAPQGDKSCPATLPPPQSAGAPLPAPLPGRSRSQSAGLPRVELPERETSA